MAEYLSEIKTISLPKGKGAKPSFSVLDIVRMIRIIGKQGLISRSALARELNIGEGTVRTLLKYLRENNFVDVKRAGIFLKERGEKIFEMLNKIIIFEDFVSKDILKELALGVFNYLIIIKGLAKKVKKGLEERDIAVRHGAIGLITMVYRNNSLVFPDSYPLDEKYEYFKQYIFNNFKLENEDLIIISCSNDKNTAIKGVYAVILSLLNES